MRSTTQRDALLKYILAEHEIDLPDLQASTIERRLDSEDTPAAVKELLRIRLQASTSSTSKYQRLIDATSEDGRLRGLLQFCGAGRTGRWAGRTFQPQNLPRPNLKAAVIEEGIELTKLGGVDLVTDNVMELCSNMLRSTLIAPPDRKLVISDLSNIEGRVLAWLAGEEWKLKAFEDYDAGVGADLYILAYARAFRIRVEDVTKDQRQIGKVMELALGYEGGVGAFVTMASAYGMDLEALARAAWASIPHDVMQEARGFLIYTHRKAEERHKLRLKKGADPRESSALLAEEQLAARHGLSEEVFLVCDSLKRLWRRAHPAIVEFWSDLATAVRMAIAKEGSVYSAGKIVVRRQGQWLKLQLPGGRALCYPAPMVAESGEISYKGTNSYTRQWGRIKTYGGKLAENATQAVARDVIAHGMVAAEAAGYEVVLSVHDELLTETPDSPEFTAEGLSACMTEGIVWAEGLPLSAKGFETHRYRKGD